MKSLAAAILAILSLNLAAQQQAVPETGSIEGIVRDGITHEPIAGVVIGVPVFGGMDPQVATDAQGRFRLDRVKTGSNQFVCGGKPGYSMTWKLDGHDYSGRGCITVIVDGVRPLQSELSIFHATIVTGRVVDLQGRPAPSVRVIAYRNTYNQRGETATYDANTQITDDRGEFRFVGNLPAGRKYGFRVEGASQELGGSPPFPGLFSPTYYPGTTDPLKAEFVSIERGGSDVSLGTITLIRETGARLRVRLIDESGQPSPKRPTTISVSQKDRTVCQGRLPVAATEADVCTLPPGSYNVLNIGDGPPRGKAHFEIGARDVTVDILLPKPARVTGEVVREPDAAGESRPFTGALLQLQSDSYIWGIPEFFTSRPQLDNSFTINDVRAGSYRAVATSLGGGAFSATSDPPPSDLFGLPDGMYVAKIVSDGGDLLKERLDVRGGEEIRVTVVVAESIGVVQGKVVDAKGNRVRGAIVALLPDDRTAWSRVAARIVDGNGNFELPVPPGAYRLYAWESMEGAAYRNAEFMKKYDDRGLPVPILKKGATFTVELKALDE